MLNNIQLVPSEFKILRAIYGVSGNEVDVTQKLNDLVADGKLNTQASNALAGDPAPGTPKFLDVEYESDAEKLSKKIAEGKMVNLP